MDLKRPKTFLAQVSLLQDRLAQLLETDWGPSQEPLTPPRFEVQSPQDQMEILGWGLPENESERTRVLFDRLSPYFETGLAFRLLGPSSQPGWSLLSPVQAFDQGQIFPLLPEDLIKKIALPAITLLEIRKINPAQLLKELSLEQIQLDPEARAFVMRPTQNDVWIFMTKLADLFLKDHLTGIQSRVLVLLSEHNDFVDTEVSP